MKRLLIYLGIALLVTAGLSRLDTDPKVSVGVRATQTKHAIKADVKATAAMVKSAAVSPDACYKCHDDQVDSYNRTTHAHTWKAELGCENCHGDVTKHMETNGAPGTIVSAKNLSAQQLSNTCLKCHERGGEQSHARMSEHAQAGVSCVNCHEVHPSKEKKMDNAVAGKSAMLVKSQSELCLSCHTKVAADFDKPTHHRLREGVLDCTSCHNPHGTDQPHQLRTTTKELCTQCHQDKRGPFMFEHNASDGDGCIACHDTHGSSAKHMLKLRDPRKLCVSCHSKEMGKGVPHGRVSLQESGDCTRCHTEIHGSNKDQYFTE